jgi:Zn-finger nucleic acid-binding protein
VAPDARHCPHCQALLATRRCLTCFALSPSDAARCTRCGALLPRAETAAPAASSCPDCKVRLDARVHGAIGYSECPRCAGLFLRRTAFDEVARSADARAVARLMEPHAAKPAAGTARFHYRRCPVCGKLMNRTNFAAGSGVVIDACKADGVWFDAGELTAIVDFVENGGYAKAREREKERLSEDIASLELRKSTAASGSLGPPIEPHGALFGGVLQLVADLFLGLK